MKQIDLRKQQESKREEDGLGKFWKSVQNVFAQLGITMEGEGDAAETVVRRFTRLLDNHYTMLQHVALPDVARRIPLVLVGPPGIVAINPRAETGVFRAREDTWVVMDRRTQKYEEAQENLLEQTEEYARMVADFLGQGEALLTDVQPLLVFANPGAHVESSRPLVRILPIDALDRYIAALVQGHAVLSASDVQVIIEKLTALPVEPEPEEPPAVAPPKTGSSTPPLSGQIDLPPALAKFNLSKRQWILIAVMAGIEFILLIFLIVFIFVNS